MSQEHPIAPRISYSKRDSSSLLVGAMLALMFSLSISGCVPETDTTSEPQEDTVSTEYTVEQARQDVIDLVTNTTQQLSADTWESTSGGTWPGYCTLPHDEEGATYSYSLFTDQRSEDLLADAKLVAEYWESLGMETRLVHEDVVSPRVFATGGPVARASFLTKTPGADRYEVLAVSDCAPGDNLELETEENKRREQREAIPGDDYFVNNPEPEATD